MRDVLWSTVLFLHLLAAVFWVGGQLMLSVVVMPLLRRTAPPVTVRELAAASGRRFTAITWRGLLPVLVVTGVLLAWHDGVRPGNLGGTAFGRVLLAKAALVGLVFGLALAHGFVASRLGRRSARGIAIATLVLSVMILGLAAALAALPVP